MEKKLYNWNTKKTTKGFVFILSENTPRKTKSKEGLYVDVKKITSGTFSTRTRAKNMAQKWTRFFKAKQELDKKIKFSFQQ